MATSDFIVENHAVLFLVKPQNEAAQKHLTDLAPSASWYERPDRRAAADCPAHHGTEGSGLERVLMRTKTCLSLDYPGETDDKRADLPFRAEQLHLRGRRNYDRYMRVINGFVDPDGPERAQWRKESAQESVRDARWNQRHGPVAGGAIVLPFCEEPWASPLLIHLPRETRAGKNTPGG